MFRYALRATFLLFIAVAVSAADQEIDSSVRRVEEAIHLKPDVDNGRNVYRICAVCHRPEGWGTQDGYYPQLAGQHASVIIKQLADTLARNRDAPTMLPFAALKDLSQQDIADVAAYLALQPMVPDNGVGPGRYLEQGRRLYEENCLDCHGKNGEGDEHKHVPLIQGQHYNYLVRQFEWIRDGKRRNADKEMVAQIKRFTERDISAVMDYTSRLKPSAERVAKPDWRNPDFRNYYRPHSPAEWRLQDMRSR